MSKSLTYEVNGPVALLTLNRPDKLNAIDTAMMAEMNAAMDQAEEDHSIRAIVVKANGKSFSAGFDLDDEVWSSDKDETFVLLCKMTLIRSCVFGIHPNQPLLVFKDTVLVEPWSWL